MLRVRMLQGVGDLAGDHGEESLAKCADMQGPQLVKPYVGDGGPEF